MTKGNAHSWPSLSYEEQVWKSAVSGWGIAVEHSFDGGRYKSAITAPIAHLDITISDETTRFAEQAATELTRLDSELGGQIANFAPVLLRSESASSSQIENLTASARAIFSAELGVTRSRNADQIAANTKAMQAAIDLSEKISAESILHMHSVLMSNQSVHAAGAWRTEPVWIGSRGGSPQGADFVAPHFQRVPAAIDDLVAFMRRQDTAPMMLVALSHAQFETIHPFTDGNGRTGRALAQSLLRHTGLTRNVALPVSAGLLADIDGYHAALNDFRVGQPEPIIRAFSAAALRAVANTRELVQEISAIRESWNSRISSRKSSNAWRILDLLMQKPVITAASAAQSLGVKPPNIYPPLQALTNCGILQSKKEHKLGPFWRSDEILHAIDRFADRAGRRSLSS